jgi:hypothetical protein
MLLTIIYLLFPLYVKNIQCPAGYTRVTSDAYGNYIRNFQIKKDRTVYLYNGKMKARQDVQYAVLDISVGNRDLQQCADAVMRIRGEYLLSVGKQPSFRSVSGKYITYKSADRNGSGAYFDQVFSYCNTHSLEQQMKSIPIDRINIGDVLIKGGFPGHAVIVVDLVVNANGEKMMMLAQSYMPAQDIHILRGPVDGIWYPVKEGDINTPEWTFQSSEARTW